MLCRRSLIKLVCLLVYVRSDGVSSSSLSTCAPLSHELHHVAARFISYGQAMQLVRLTSPEDEIIAALDSLLSMLRIEQMNADAKHNIIVRTQSASISQNRNNIISQTSIETDTKTQLDRLDALISSSQTIIDSKMASLSAINVVIAQRTAELASATITRTANHATNSAAIAAHITSIATVNSLLGLIDAMKLDSALIAIKSLSNGIHEANAKLCRRLIIIASGAINEALDAPPSDANGTKLRAHLHDMIARISAGLKESMALYESDESTQQTQFDQLKRTISELMIGYNQNMISIKGQIDNEVDARASLIATRASTLAAHQAAYDARVGLQAQIDSLMTALPNEQSRYDSETNDRRIDLEMVEEARAYVLRHIGGFTIAEACHPSAPGCPRCLYDKHCSGGLICSSDGNCMEAPASALISGTVDEGQLLSLSCANARQTIVEIVFASFGQASAIGPGQFIANTECNAGSSQVVLSNLCLGNATCHVRADTSVFGDPCFKQAKKLTVAVSCDIDRTLLTTNGINVAHATSSTATTRAPDQMASTVPANGPGGNSTWTPTTIPGTAWIKLVTTMAKTGVATTRNPSTTAAITTAAATVPPLRFAANQAEFRLLNSTTMIEQGMAIGGSFTPMTVSNGEYTYAYFIRVQSITSIWANIFNVQPSTADETMPRLPSMWIWHADQAIYASLSTDVNSNEFVASADAVVANQWMFVALTVSSAAKTMKLYTRNIASGVDVNVVSRSIKGTPISDPKARVYMSERNPFNGVDGEVTHMSFFNFVLSAYQVRQYMLLSVPAPTPISYTLVSATITPAIGMTLAPITPTALSTPDFTVAIFFRIVTLPKLQRTNVFIIEREDATADGPLSLGLWVTSSGSLQWAISTSSTTLESHTTQSNTVHLNHIMFVAITVSSSALSTSLFSAVYKGELRAQSRALSAPAIVSSQSIIYCRGRFDSATDNAVESVQKMTFFPSALSIAQINDHMISSHVA